MPLPNPLLVALRLATQQFFSLRIYLLRSGIIDDQRQEVDITEVTGAQG
jgi:hypothetical protein